jgi:hypothetical protein
MGQADQSVDLRQLGLALEEVESSQGTSFGCSAQLSAQMIFIRLSPGSGVRPCYRQAVRVMLGARSQNIRA